ncbi:MAG TPA: CBS domain-containing protein [Thermodesulfobacteriota bacterium]|nr:CBS domain-containing protein [Thermodesulfobacteriota bacterium]
MIVKNFMTRNPLTVTPEEDVVDTFNLLKKQGFRQFPVVKDKELVGIITDRDLRSNLRDDLMVSDVMSPNPVTILEDSKLVEAALIIRDRKFNALPVVSKSGELVGIITTTDIIKSLVDVIVSLE